MDTSPKAQYDKDLFVIFLPCHTEHSFCHTERSEVSIKSKCGYFATLNMTRKIRLKMTRDEPSL